MSGKAFVVRSGALIAWSAPASPDDTRQMLIDGGWRIIGAHTDSPNLRLKPNSATTSVGYRQLAVEIYGGVLANSWLDRDLGISGRLILTDGTSRLVRVDRGVARVAQLAIHLDREVNEKGLVLDKQLHLLPLAGLGTHDDEAFIRWLLAAAGFEALSAEDIAAHDLMLHDITPPALLGMDEEFVVSGRIDNLFSCWAAVDALLSPPSLQSSTCAQANVSMIALFDHEEVGSSSTTGASGPLLETVIDRMAHSAGLDADQRARALAASTCLSSDMAHGVHPNYADRHEPGHRPMPNAGPVIKVNANQRYATSATGAASFRAACERADVPVQTFVSKNSQPCGSTIGPLTATRLGIETIDVGCAMLSMHSARELCGAADAELYLRALRSYLNT